MNENNLLWTCGEIEVDRCWEKYEHYVLFWGDVEKQGTAWDHLILFVYIEIGLPNYMYRNMTTTN